MSNPIRNKRKDRSSHQNKLYAGSKITSQMRHFFKSRLGVFSSLKVRLRILFVGLIIICFLGIVAIYQTQSDVRFCFMAPASIKYDNTLTPHTSTGNVFVSLEDVLTAAVQPTPGKSIFFHETSCHRTHRSHVQSMLDSLTASNLPTQSQHMAQLNARQACAIESAALHNPNLNIFVLFASAVYMNNGTSLPLLDAILTYSNVHLRNLNLWTYAAKTPMIEWLNTGNLFRSRYVLSHLSDFLRYLTLWRYGGTYLDMDVVVLRNIEDMPPNYTGAESDRHLAAGVMNFEERGFGHEVAHLCLMDFVNNFDGSDWGNNGPGVITRVMSKICNVERVSEMLGKKHCNGFRIYDRDAFYAIPFNEWEHFFEAQYLEDTLKRTHNSYVVHVWNQFSKQRRIKVGSKAAYGIIAEKHCPKVYAAAGEYF